MEAGLRLSLLGKPQVTEFETPVAGFISVKAEALLYYLAATGVSHSRDGLASLLWGEMPQELARKNLTKALSNLRKLAGPYLTVDHQTVVFKQDSVHWLDTRAFEAALATGALEDLQTAAALYRGDFLEGFYIKDAPAFEEWQRAEQERWRELVLHALELLARQLAAGGHEAAAIAAARRAVNLDSYRETAHRQLMILLARIGQRSAALAQYDLCRRILAEELAVEPSAETQALYQRIKAGTMSIPHNLPNLTPLFVGRDVELAKIILLLNDPACRLLTITGPGGIGKTRLALQIAGHYARQTVTFDADGGFPDGVYLLRLAPLNSIEAIISTLAEALGFSFQQDSEPQQQVLNYLRQKSLLLVLDNFEHFLPAQPASVQQKVDGVKLVTTLLESAPEIKILTISRSRLNLLGEHTYYLGGLPFPDWEYLETGKPAVDHRGPEWVAQATAYSAVQLFINQVRQAQPDFELTGDNVIDVVKICRLVQGMPLGILLAAAWVELLTPAEIATEIARSLDFLETKMHDVPPRQQSIRAAFDYSWNLLTHREQAIFQQLSVFHGHFSRQAVQAVTGASLPELMALANKSLLRRTTHGHCLVHNLLRQYAAEKLDQSPDGGQAAHQRHSAYYIDLLQQFEQKLQGPRQRAALAEIDAEGENIRTAWNWAVRHQQAAGLNRAMDGLGYFYIRRGRYREGEAAFRGAAVELDKSGASLETERIQAKLAAWQAVFNHQLGQPEIASQLLQKSLMLLDDLDRSNPVTQAARAFTLLQMGEITREADRQAARQFFEQSLALYQALDDPWGRANTLASLGWLIQHLGAYDEARQLYSKSLSLRQRLEDRWGMANSLIALGSVALYQGYPEEAGELVQQSIALHQELDDRAGLAYSISKRGETLIWLGKFTEALIPLEESKIIYNNLGLHDRAAFSVAMLASAMIHLGQYESALHQAQLALTHFQELGSRRGTGYGLLMMGWAYLGAGQTARARQFLQESLAIYREIGQRDELAQALALLGYAAYQLDDLKQAHQYLMEGLRTATQIRAFMPMVLALPAVTLLLGRQNRIEEALELIVLASRYPFVAGSRWFEQITREPMDAITNTLPSHLVASVKERGSAQTLEEVVEQLLKVNSTPLF